ncbi:MAG: flagellar biosynthetic protein FliO [Anaerolineae bacterium]|nr:flagellar biosynthetic protein FliO [Anaerolineae bacterium]
MSRWARAMRWLIAGLLACVLWASSSAVVVSCALDGAGDGTGLATQPASGFLVRDYGEVSPSVAMDSEPMGWQVALGVVGSLALVVVAIYGVLWVMKTLLQRKNVMMGRPNLIRVWERTHLSPNRSLYLVEVGERVLLLGATDSQVNLLTELDRAVLAEQDPFATRLAQVAAQEPNPVASWKDAGTALEGLRATIARLRDVHGVEEP